MGKILVLYHSNTDHTRKMAEHVARGAGEISGMEVRLKSTDQADKDDVLWCEGLAVGSPTNLGLASWQMKRFWDGVCGDLWGKVDGRIACAFSSSGGWGGGAELACASMLTLLMNFGFLVFGVTDYVDDQMTLHYGAVTAGEPRRDADIKACRRLGKRLAQWVAVYVEGRKECHPGPISQRGKQPASTL